MKTRKPSELNGPYCVAVRVLDSFALSQASGSVG